MYFYFWLVKTHNGLLKEIINNFTYYINFIKIAIINNLSLYIINCYQAIIIHENWLTKNYCTILYTVPTFTTCSLWKFLLISSYTNIIWYIKKKLNILVSTNRNNCVYYVGRCNDIILLLCASVSTYMVPTTTKWTTNRTMFTVRYIYRK